MKAPYALILCSAIVFVVWVGYNTTPTAHHPHWWVDVGIQETKLHHRVVTTRGPQTAPKVVSTVPVNPDGSAKIVRGVDFLADYGVEGVVEQPFPYTPDSYFRYPKNGPGVPPFRWASMEPRVLLAPKFLSDEECDLMIKKATPMMARSGVVPVDQKEAKPGEQYDKSRTSTQTWLPTGEPPVRDIVERLKRLTGFDGPGYSSEMLQILRYDKGQRYESHTDYFTQDFMTKEGNRAITVFMYLSDVEEGGETVFPRANGKPPMYDWKKCDQGLRVRPRKGSMALFYDMRPDGTYDDRSLHGGCPPVVGTKWGATLWLWVKWRPTRPPQELTPPPTAAPVQQQQQQQQLPDSNRHAAVLEVNGGGDGDGTPQDPIAMGVDIQPGVDYLADYDVRAVKEKPFPYTPYSYFHYPKNRAGVNPFRWASMSPRILLSPNFLSTEECDELIAIAKPKLVRSGVVPRNGKDHAPAVDPTRTSHQTWLPLNGKVTSALSQRILTLVGDGFHTHEMLQILRYEGGQKYNSHTDYLKASWLNKDGNRAITCFLYLADVEEGGETVFPRADGKPPMYNWTKCDQGLRVRPKKGTLALFYDMRPDGTYDELSLHGGCPPVVGTKWGATLWLWVKWKTTPPPEITPPPTPHPEKLPDPVPNNVQKVNGQRVFHASTRTDLLDVAAKPAHLIPGVDYEADYDVDSVSPPPTTYPQDAAFQYVHPRSKYPHKWVSTAPRALLAPKFITDEECDGLIKLATPKLQRSTVKAHPGQAQPKNDVDEVRTSEQTWLMPDDPFARDVVPRILEFVGLPKARTEQMQILRYKEGQHYHSHTDFFPTSLVEQMGNNRVITVFLYLNDVAEGGETVFPMADGKPQEWNFTRCDVGLRVKPRKGTLAVFYNMRPDYSYDLNSMHGACPPRNGGVKWGGTLWIWLPIPEFYRKKFPVN